MVVRKTPVASAKLNLTDLLRVASTDKRMASALLKDPDSFAKAYNLNPKQLAGLKDVAGKLKGGLDLAAADISYE